MHPQPLVSFIILSYNHEKFIEQAVLSAIAQQGNFRKEIIISDDASTDATKEIVKKLQIAYPEIINLNFQKENLGVWKNLTSALSLCKGDFVAFLDGDDYWINTNKTENQLDIFHNKKDCALVHTNLNIHASEQGAHPFNLLSNAAIPQGDIYQDLLKENCIANSTVIARTELVREALAFFEVKAKQFCVQDYPLWLYLASKHSVYYLPESTCVYRHLLESLSHSTSLEKTLRWKDGIFEIRLFFQNNVRQITERSFFGIKQEYIFEKLLLLWKNKKDISSLLTEVKGYYKQPKAINVLLTLPVLALKKLLKQY